MHQRSAAAAQRHDADAPVVTQRGRRARVVSVGTKLAGATVLLMLVVTAIVYDGLSSYQRENLLGAKAMAAIAVSRLFADSCAAPIVFGDTGAIRDALANLGRGDDIPYASVWSSDDAGRLSMQLTELGAGERVRPTDIPAALEVRREAARLVLFAPIRDLDAKLVGLAVVTFSLARENRLIGEVRRSTLFASAAIAAGLTLLLSIIARVAIVRPLGKLVAAANAIERGQSSSIEVHSRDEIGQLAAAFRSMSQAIESRERRITARNRDMRMVLDNVGQGFLTLDAEGLLSEERSRILHEWFGQPEPGATFWEYIGRIDPEAGERFEVGWMLVADRLLPIQFGLEQLPRRAHAGERTFELAYRAVWNDDAVEALLVVVSDISAGIERERALLAQRETLSVFQHIMTERVAFDEFFEEAASMVAAIQRADGSDGVALRHTLHTLKGGAASFGLESIAEYCHALETALEDAERTLTAEQRQELDARWARLRQIVEQFRVDPGISVSREEHRALVAALEGRAPAELSSWLASWQFEAAGGRLALLGKKAQALAERLGKGPLSVHIEPTELRLPPKRWAPLWTALAHVLRNAVDHGIEPPEERQQAGKAAPVVTLALARVEGRIVLTVRDDGRGIDWERVAERARALGLAADTPEELEAALFADGVSSRSEVTAISGRGVGLGAVRDVVRRLGGRMEIESVPKRGTCVAISLPEEILNDDGARDGRSMRPRLLPARGEPSARQG
jgi:signal transduction histidine kinase/HAMP domain-containing protein